MPISQAIFAFSLTDTYLPTRLTGIVHRQTIYPKWHNKGKLHPTSSIVGLHDII